LRRQRVRDPRPAAPLVVERDACVHHRAPLRQEYVLDGPVEAAGRAKPRDVPASLDDSRLGSLEDTAPVRRVAIRAAAWLVTVENLEAAQHPGGLPPARAEGQAPGDPIAAAARDGAPAAHHGRAGNGRVGPLRVELLHALVRQPERDELSDAVVAQVPADRAGSL